MINFQKVAIFGVPRSGTSWLGAIFDSSEYVAYRFQPLFSYAFKDALNEKSNLNEINDFFTGIYKSNDDFILQKEKKKSGKYPEFEKKTPTHVIFKEARYLHIIENLIKQDPTLKIIGIVRNPKSVISSWYCAPKEFKKEHWDLLQEWKDASLKNERKKENFYGYLKWKETTKMFLTLKQQYPKQFYLVKYSSLLKNTEQEVSKVFDFVELPFTNQTQSFLIESLNIDDSKDHYSIFRKNQDDNKWKKILPKKIIEEIDNDLKNTELEEFLK